MLLRNLDIMKTVLAEICGAPNPDIDDALATAQLAHLGQTRRSGEDYIEHPKEVAEIVYDYYRDPLLCAAALMHDVLEDAVDQGNIANLEDAATMISASLGDESDGREVLRIVKSLSHEKWTPYTEYVLTLVNDPSALRVKLADILHNLQSQPSDRQKRKYSNALHALYNTSQGIPAGINPAHWEDLMKASQVPDINEEYLREYVSLIIGRRSI